MKFQCCFPWGKSFPTSASLKTPDFSPNQNNFMANEMQGAKLSVKVLGRNCIVVVLTTEKGASSEVQKCRNGAHQVERESKQKYCEKQRQKQKVAVKIMKHSVCFNKECQILSFLCSKTSSKYPIIRTQKSNIHTRGKEQEQGSESLHHHQKENQCSEPTNEWERKREMIK